MSEMNKDPICCPWSPLWADEASCWGVASVVVSMETAASQMRLDERSLLGIMQSMHTRCQGITLTLLIRAVQV